MTKYIIRDREAGNTIVELNTMDEAVAMLCKFEEEDRQEGWYEPDFYEIKVNMDLEEVEGGEPN